MILAKSGLIPAGTALVWLLVMRTTLLIPAVALGLALWAAAPRAQNAPSTDASAFAWADSCKKCHEPIYEAWARTKHAKALERLSSSEQDKECIGCHVTGPKSRVKDGSKTLNAGVQCESCHGAAAAHVADPTVTTGLVKKPAAAVCEECHNAKGPHFRGFFYGAMTTLVHRVK